MAYVDNGDVSIYYIEEGNPDGEPLVLMHWFMGSHKTWFDVGWVRVLEPYFRLILVDHRGYGNSTKPHDPDDYLTIKHVSDLNAVLDDLGIDQAHFFGYSMGGRIGYAMGAFTPDRVKSLVVGGMHPFSSDRIPTDLEHRIELLQKGMKVTLDAYGIGPKKVYDRMLENDPKALLADARQTQQWDGIADKLQGFSRPVLLYVGRHDGFYDGVREFSTYLGNGRMVSFDGENHRSAFIKRHLLVPHLSRFYGYDL